MSVSNSSLRRKPGSVIIIMKILILISIFRDLVPRYRRASRRTCRAPLSRPLRVSPRAGVARSQREEEKKDKHRERDEE